MATYIGLIWKDKDSDYGVTFPDFPGCVTAGTTAEEARFEAKEALQFHIDGMIEDGDQIPEPSTLDDILANEENKGAAAFLIDVDVPTDKAVRINVTIPERVLKQIDAHSGGNRSGFLTEAAKRYIQDRKAS